MSDPRKAKTLGEACDNGDGTFNGARLLSWLSECVNPGRGVPLTEVEEICRQAAREKREKHGESERS